MAGCSGSPRVAFYQDRAGPKRRDVASFRSHGRAVRGKMDRKKRPKVELTDEWDLLLPLFEWPEQQAYEELRPLVLFGSSVAERAAETGTPERTMYRRVERFEADGMLSLFVTDPAMARARRQGLEPYIRRMIVELKAEHPKLNNNETSNIVYVRTGRRLGKHTPARVLADEVVPLKLSRLLEPYHETEDSRDRLRHPEEDGRLALPEGRDLPGAGRGPRCLEGCLEGGPQRPTALGPREAGGRPPQPARRPRLLHGEARRGGQLCAAGVGGEKDRHQGGESQKRRQKDRASVVHSSLSFRRGLRR